MTIQAIESQAREGGGAKYWLYDAYAKVVGRAKLGPYAKLERYGLGRDLTLPLIHPKAKIPIAVRRLEQRDFPSLFGLKAAGEGLKEKAEVAVRRVFLAKGATNGYVAIDQRNGSPCYVQWLFGAQDNDLIRTLKGFPRLAQHQALLENAYTPPAYRGMGIMSAAMALIAERAVEIGARQVLTFVTTDNVASLKGCHRSGFNPVLVHHSVRIGFGVIRRDWFEPLPESDSRRTTFY